MFSSPEYVRAIQADRHREADAGRRARLFQSLRDRCRAGLIDRITCRLGLVPSC